MFFCILNLNNPLPRGFSASSLRGSFGDSVAGRLSFPLRPLWCGLIPPPISSPQGRALTSERQQVGNAGGRPWLLTQTPGGRKRASLEQGRADTRLPWGARVPVHSCPCPTQPPALASPPQGHGAWADSTGPSLQSRSAHAAQERRVMTSKGHALARGTGTSTVPGCLGPREGERHGRGRLGKASIWRTRLSLLGAARTQGL